MNDEPITSRELIAAYRSQVRPSAAARERMLQAISAPRREAAPPPAPPRAAPLWLALAAALTLLAVSAYLLAGARHDAHVAPAEMMMAPQVTPPSQDAVTTTRESPHPTPDPPAPTEPPAIPEQPEQPAPGESTHSADPPANEATRPGERLPPGESTHSADPPSPRPRPRAEPTGDQVLAELALIQRIKEALDADQPARALTLVEQHARSFARGTLIEEREALRVVALCADDDPKRGLRAQRSFLRAYPRSAYGDRVRGACPAEPSPHFP